MADDIVTRLRFEAVWYLNHADGDVSTSLAEAADEIERLRAALALAVGELSTSRLLATTHPEQLMQQFLDEARRG